MGLGINSGGLSKGGPIWPGKPAHSKELAPTEEAFQIHKEVSAPGTKSAGNVSAAGRVATPPSEATQSTQATLPTQVKGLTVNDILQQLANIKVAVNDQNKELALLMAAHSIEISEESFAMVNKLLKGKNSPQARQSAVLLVSKGLGESVKDVGVLQNILSKQSLVSQSLNQLTQMAGKMSQLMQQSLSNHPGLQAFIGLFSEFNESLNKLNVLSSSNQLAINPAGILDDLVTMETFLSGLVKKGILSPKHLKEYLDTLNQLKQNLLGQMILSQDSIKQPLGLLETFHYFQLPNPLAAQSAIELLLRKRANRPKSKSPNTPDAHDQEKIIISLDSEELGQMTVVVTVMGFKVWCMVYSDNQDTVLHANAFRKELADSLSQYEYKMEEFKTARKTVNIKKFMAPSQNISDVKRIQTEI